MFSACRHARLKAQVPRKIALLAPFEGQYRDIGYNALYALRMAFADTRPHDTQLLAIDDGGTVESAIDRVRALNLDPAVETVIVLGPYAAHPTAQSATDKIMIIIGNWGHDRAADNVLFAANRTIVTESRASDLLMADPLRERMTGTGAIEIYSVGSLPDQDFSQRYLESALYAPQPNLLATLTYDLGRLVISAVAARQSVATTAYHGINGHIQFEDGYWTDAPLNHYRSQNGEWILVSP